MGRIFPLLCIPTPSGRAGPARTAAFFSIFLLLVLGQCDPSAATSFGKWPRPLDATMDPQQKSVSLEPMTIYFRGGWAQLKPVAQYRLTGVIKGIRTYRRDWNSRLSPVDLVLVWGDLPLASHDQYMTYRQRNRWYYYRYRPGFPAGASYIVRHSSNNHIIPATDNLRRLIRRLKQNQVIFLDGYLVKIEAMFRNRRYWWNSSLSRQDTGDGSCEVFYVKRIIAGGKEYR